MIEFVAGLAGLGKLRFQLSAPGRLFFQGGRGLLGSGIGGMKLLVLVLEMSPGALEVHSVLTQPLLQIVEAGVRIGWSRLCRGSRRRRFILAQKHPRGQGRWLRCDRWGGGWWPGLGSRFGWGSLEDVRDALDPKGERSGYPCPASRWG